MTAGTAADAAVRPTLKERVAAWSWAQWLSATLMVVVLAAAAVLVHNVVARAGEPDTRVPQNAAMEKALGVRMSRVAVVGDGGLVTLSFVALDVDKAQAFMADRDHVPELVAEDRTGGTHRVSIMRQGHNVRAGSTYYFVYQNTDGAIRAGEHVTVVVGSQRLEHVPVL